MEVSFVGKVMSSFWDMLSLRWLWDTQVSMKVASTELWCLGGWYVGSSSPTVIGGDLQVPCEEWEEKKTQTRTPGSTEFRDTLRSRRREEAKKSNPIFFFLLLPALSSLALAKVEWGQGDFWAPKIFLMHPQYLSQSLESKGTYLMVVEKNDWMNKFKSVTIKHRDFKNNIPVFIHPKTCTLQSSCLNEYLSHVGKSS